MVSQQSQSSEELPIPQFYPANRQRYSRIHRYLVIIFYILCMQIPFLLSVGILLYALVTMNVKLMVGLLIMVVIQMPISRIPWMIQLINKYAPPTLYYRSFRRYYQENINITKEESEKRTKKILFGMHPHGIIPYAIMANVNAGDDALSRATGMGSRMALNLPLTGAQAKLWGLQSVDPSNFRQRAKEGKILGLVPGGFQQSTIHSNKQLRVYIKKRKGFIKYALQQDYTIYPVLFLNQHRSIWNLDGFWNIRLWLNKFKIPTVLFWGRWGLIEDPEIDMISIVGRGIKGKDGSPDQLERVHKKYIEELQRIYKKYRHLNGNVPMKIH